MQIKTIEVPITEARTQLCALLKRVEAENVGICLTRHGRPKALIIPFRAQRRPWRAEKPADAKRYGNLQSAVL
jgi:prevent-host-death family protein